MSSRELAKIVTQAEAEAGVLTDPRTFTPERIAQAIAALAGTGSGAAGLSLDGGGAGSVYLPTQGITGGSATSTYTAAQSIDGGSASG